MNTISKRLTHWLNVLLIFTLLGSLLPPPPRVWASTTASSPTGGHFDSQPIDHPRPFHSDSLLLSPPEKANELEAGPDLHFRLPHRVLLCSS